MSLAITLKSIGGPEMLQHSDIEVGMPTADWVRIKQTVAGVNFVDIYFRMGLYPLTGESSGLGLEGAGVVDAVGPEVRNLRVGDRVAYAGMPIGAYAEVRLLPESRLLRIPDDIGDRVAGSMMLRGLTAQMLLRKVYQVAAGDWLLVHAAAGGLGQILTRWARALGANVIGTTGSAAKIKMIEAAGANAVLLNNDPGWVAQARQIAGGKGVHFAIDGIGGDMLARSIAAVRPFGTAASVGQPAGPIPPIRVEELGGGRAIALVRPSVIAYANDPEFYQAGAQDLFAAIRDGLSQPSVAEYALRDARQAHEDLEAGRTTGSVMLTI